ncbi:MAG: hypothetical protein HGA82_03875 [Anaerolineales bacterium]|nr:hypothetical protein [Anaerolineales bacterium]
MAVKRIPLFPLGLVLLPGMVLPLHIFEERYRGLIEALLSLPDGAVRQFGVICIRAGAEAGQPRPVVYEVGCTAELREVTPYSDGRFDIVSVGETRFRLVGIDGPSIEPYTAPDDPVHRSLLAASVIIVENLALAGVAPGAYELTCLPLPIAGCDGAPARVVLASIDD